MACSASLACIYSALDDLQLLENLSRYSKQELIMLTAMKVRLGKIRTFLMYARKWGNDDTNDATTLGELVIRMEAIIFKLGQEIHRFYLTKLEDRYSGLILYTGLEGEINSCDQEISEWYLVFSEWSSTRASNSLVMKDELLEFTDSVLEHLGDMILITDEEQFKLKSLQEMLIFLRNIICFVTLDGGLEDVQLGPLLGHAELIALNVASLSIGWINNNYTSIDGSSDMLQKIIRMEPQVHETCVQALIASKLSIQSCGGAYKDHFLGDFVNSLMFYLSEMIKAEVCHTTSLNDQLEMLWEGLGFLSIILSGNPRFDEKFRDLIRLLLCDAGLLLFSLSFSAVNDNGSVIDIDLASFQDFNERLEFIKATVAKMASSSLTCVSSAMDDLQFLENLCPKSPYWDNDLLWLVFLKKQLGIWRTFLLYSRKWGYGDDASLGSLVIRIEAVVSKVGQVIRDFYLTTREDGYCIPFSEFLPADFKETEYFVHEINQWYLVFSSTRGSNSLLSRKDLMEFMDSVVQHLILYLNDEPLHGALQEMVAFLRNFICFVTLHGVEDGQLVPLLTHAEFVTLRAVSVSMSWMCGDCMLLDGIFDLLQKMIHVEPQVHETCVQALTASKLSTQPFGEADEHLLGDFVDSLLFYLMKIVKTEFYLRISPKDQLQMLPKGIGFLRTILKGNPMFDEKMRDLARLLLCDAGLVLFSLRDESIKEADVVSLEDFMGRLKLIKAAFAEVCQVTSSSSEFPMTDVLGFIDFLVNYMTDLTCPEGAESVALVNYPIQLIQEELLFFRSFLEKVVKIHHEDEEVQELWDCMVAVAYKIEFLIDSLLVGAIVDSCSMFFDSIVNEMKNIKADALNTKRLDDKLEEVTKSSGQIPSPKSKPMISNVVVGLMDEAASIINQLTRGSSKLQIVPIVGMPGIGKTTLAKKVYTDSTVESYFYRRCWCTVSHVYHKKHLLLEILTCIHSKLLNNFAEKCAEDLALEVKQCLSKTRFLIVLDDIWDIEVWNDLEAIFRENQEGSRVIFTSRDVDIATSKNELSNEPSYIRPLNDDDSWELLNMMLYPGKEDFPSPELGKLRTQIMKICRGLPLTIVILAGILANQDQIFWGKIVEEVNSSIIAGTERCIATLELSYQNLPDNLKPCFLYFGAFAEDHEHIIEDLIWLWVAEGFSQKNLVESAEEVANDYMRSLIDRSLVMVSKEKSTGGAETCRIHDLLHEFCMRKCIEENFWLFVHRYSELHTLHISHHLRRVCINSSPNNSCDFRLFAPAIRSVSFSDDVKSYQDVALVVQMFKLVRVLVLSRVDLGSSFPKELDLLVQLRYLAIKGEIRSVPPSIANLLHLETFIIVETDSYLASLPDTIWNMKKLRHLQVKHRSGYSCLFEFPIDNLDNTAKLCALRTLSGVRLPSLDTFNKILRQFPNIRKMGCDISIEDDPTLDSTDTILALDFLLVLESLTLKYNRRAAVQCHFEFRFSPSIRELTLSGFRFPWSKMSTIEILPNLEVLNLLWCAFDGDIWNVEDNQGFPKVKFLQISTLYFVKWTASECEECFPSLRKLVVEWCLNLREIPPCLGRDTIEVIEVRHCPYSTNLIKQIKDEQEDLGNTELKIIVDS